MSRHHVHYDFFVGGASLIIRSPATVYKLKLAIDDKLANIIFHRIFLEVPPALKVVHFGLREPASLILLKCLHNIGNDIGNASLEVLLRGHLPADIVMRVAH